MKKIIALLMATFMFSCVTVTNATATYDGDSKMYATEEGRIIIEVNTEEEYNAVVQKIKKMNEYSEMLWEKALEESVGNNGGGIGNTPLGFQPRVYTVASATYSFAPTGLYLPADLQFVATYDTNTNSAGVTTINAVYSLNAYNNSAGGSLAVNDARYTLIDSSRTIAANYSCYVGIKSMVSGSLDYFTLNCYVEFYSNGNGTVWSVQT